MATWILLGFALITLIPFAGWYLVFAKGEPTVNKYGFPLTARRAQ